MYSDSLIFSFFICYTLKDKKKIVTDLVSTKTNKTSTTTSLFSMIRPNLGLYNNSYIILFFTNEYFQKHPTSK